MKKMDVVFILDKSGSMCDLVDDAVGGYNSLLEKTKKLDADIRVTTVLFDTSYNRLYDRVDIREVPKMTKDDYTADGCTALLDAVGTTIDFFDDLSEEKEDAIESVLFYITTDGMENSSQEYSFKMIERMIKMHKKLGWKFEFLASGINCEKVGSAMGLDAKECRSVPVGKRGQKEMYDTLCAGIKSEVLSFEEK